MDDSDASLYIDDQDKIRSEQSRIAECIDTFSRRWVQST